ncbi:universal stress protein [Streptomyces odonnellii]|uniref:universal stress protein n=1 Tax=Streptomyces odonnellii TaxID=1417980 RepID=UPI0006251644|nr:universal stress protein [Streptomyces odonnellii]
MEAMGLPLVVGVDGSEGSGQAVEWAAAEADRSCLPLRLVYASLWEHYEGIRSEPGTDRPYEEVLAEDLLAAAEERAHRIAADVKVSTAIQPEDPVTALLREALDASFLVLGPHGHGPVAGLLLGSVSLAVAARAPCPVIVARGEEPNLLSALRRVAVGVGDGPGSAAAVRFAFREARWRGCELLAVRAWHLPAHETLPHPLTGADRARAHRREAGESADRVMGLVSGKYPEVAARRRLVPGPVHQVLLDESAGADLLVVGAERRHPVVGLPLGRVHHAVLRHSACPVAIVPVRG